MKKTISKLLSLIALICSMFPVLSYILAAFKVTLSGGMQTVLTGVNILCVLLGLGLSIACVKSNETRSITNIVSTIISIFWILMIAGFLALALFLSSDR